jgi:hypothetical protein
MHAPNYLNLVTVKIFIIIMMAKLPIKGVTQAHINKNRPDSKCEWDTQLMGEASLSNWP